MELTQLEYYFAKFGKQNILDLYSAYRSDLYRSGDEIWREFALKFKVVTKGTKYVNLRTTSQIASSRAVFDEVLDFTGRKASEHYEILVIRLRNGRNEAVLSLDIDVKEIENAIEENVN